MRHELQLISPFLLDPRQGGSVLRSAGLIRRWRATFRPRRRRIAFALAV